MNAFLRCFPKAATTPAATKLAAVTLAAVALGAVGLGATAPGAASAAEIRVLNWQGYGTDIDWAVEAWSTRTGHSVRHEYFNSEQEMLTKLRTNPGAYDVVLVNAAFIEQAQKEDLLSVIDRTKIKNFKDLAPNMAGNPNLAPGGKLRGVPWTWGLTSYAVNKDRVSGAPNSINVFWDRNHKGRVSIRDDAIENVQFAAIATGQNINRIQDLDKVRDKLATLLPNVAFFWTSENDWNQNMASGQFDIGTFWSGSASRSIASGLNIEYVVPDEGAIGWLDSLAVPNSSRNKDAAYAFIDWMIDPGFYARWEPDGAPASANAAAANSLPADSFNRRVLGDPDVVARVQFQGPVRDADREAYLELWQELKASQ